MDMHGSIAPGAHTPQEDEGMGIAIVGMAGRFPGADDVDAFWERVRDGIESVVTFTDDALRARGVPEAMLKDPAYVKAGVPFDGMDQFDAAFFGYTPREACRLDPQQRVFLECAWQAMEHAGYDVDRIEERVGVYAGAGANLYLLKHLLPAQPLDGLGGIADLLGLLNGNSADSLSTRVAYKLNLRGPAVTVQTACSTSLAAVHMACQALLNLDCDMALAGGVWLNLLQSLGYRHQQGAILSSDGRCRAFDAQADGTALGSGVGIVVLKRLDQALRDGDTIHAVIQATALNNDGAHKVGYTAPSVDGQADVIRTAQTLAGVEADSIGYVEAHGTGTTLGDPIEIEALTQAFRASTARQGFCAVGSVKTNVGHLDAAAGVTGLIKTVMALRHQTLPPSLHFNAPNPAIDFARSPFHVNTQARAWPRGATPRRAGVSSFGMGGTNVHAILQEHVALPHGIDAGQDASKDAAQLLMLSARSEAALSRVALQLAAHLQRHPTLPLADVAHTLQQGRKRFACRVAVVARTHEEAIEALSGCTPQHLAQSAWSAPVDQPATVAFLFPGQGSQHVGMARALYEREAVFRETVDACCRILASRTGMDLLGWIHPVVGSDAEATDAAEALARTDVTQPALFVIEYAMARWWMSRGVQPDALLGHSIGEYVAACLAGVFSLEEALVLVAERGRLLASTQPGAMLAVTLSESAVQPHLRAGCDLAAVNAPDHCVLSGRIDVIEAVARDLQAQGIGARRLVVSHAFHSALTEPILAAFETALRQCTLRAPSLPFVSNVTGRWITDDEARSVTYWVRHLRGTVRFAQGLDVLLDAPARVLLEVGPGETLSKLAKQSSRIGARPVLSSQAHPRAAGLQATQALRCLAGLWQAGVTFDEAVSLSGHDAALRPARRVPLPAYPFERQSHWVVASEPPAPSRVRADAREGGIEGWLQVPVWRRALPKAVPAASVPAEPVGCTLVLGGGGPFSATLMARLALVGGVVIRVDAGQAYAQINERHVVVRPDAKADHERLLKDVSAAWGPVGRICHAWTLDASSADVEPMPSPSHDLARGLFSLQALAQALSCVDAASAHGLSLTVLTQGLADVTGTEALDPLAATLHGPCQVMPMEVAGVRCQLIDLLPVASQTEQTRVVEQVVREMQSSDSDTVVALRGPHRWTRAQEALPLEAEATPRLKRGGIYLITGGLGGVGLALARRLASTWQARVVLLTRRAVPPSTEWAGLLQGSDTPAAMRATLQSLLDLTALTAPDAAPLVLQADVTDAASVAAALAQVQARWGAVDGVIHAAGEAGGGLMAMRTPDDVSRTLAAKVAGARVLVDAFAQQPLDFMCLCSSITAITGGIGQMAYCAANAHLDALAWQCARQGQGKVLSINWDTWRGVGMAASQRLQDGVGLSEDEGAEVFERLIQAQTPAQVVVSTVPWAQQVARVSGLSAADEVLGQVLGEVNTSVAEGHALHARPSLSTPYAPPDSELEARLAALWSACLGIGPVGVRDNFFELNGDSLLAIQLLSRVRGELGVEIAPSAFFQKPCIAEMAVLIEIKWIEDIENASLSSNPAHAVVAAARSL